MATYYIYKTNFLDILADLAKNFRTFYLTGKGTQFDWKAGTRKLLFWQEYKGDLQELVLGGVRAQDPLKQFVFSSKEKVSKDFKGLEDNSDKPVMLIGAKNCDLVGLEITDFVFLNGDFKDPFYINKRQSMFIIASDCTNPLDTCFCLALGIQPYPEKIYDMGVCDIGDSCVVEAASERANRYIVQYKDKIQLVSGNHLQKREEVRSNTIKAVEDNVKKYGIPDKTQLRGVMQKGFDSQIWKDEIQTCVECGCCNFICPTCHCFFLGDSKKGDSNTRYKMWDACLYKDFAVVAGGANPRKRLFQRLRNRYDKKFNFFPNVSGKIACTGCGRCITGCPAKIDIRRILKNLVSEAKSGV
ncbi:MAG: 4Fe-4S dicluster domain-containing protein [Candidatus Omnitrophica bacterium]|nr:4Fe-4S dicluster domain-containing protein [Candidatus Omnitrophota bacterium]MDD5352512.1 4Fe-4S dicluster domain-containing protein [Candidatus Omnitrophota bacterium]MDD5550110.1 4Fe-4S dicluster domain-containing protein [Candidatus Omnitrophota bacterium]